jgi:phage terminase small subunit
VTKLSAQQEAFCRYVVEGMNQTEAYFAAGYTGKPESAWANSSRLIGTDKVAARIDELKAEATKKTVLSVAHFANRLERIAAAAFRNAITEGVDGAPDSYASKEAADVVRQCSMDAAKLLGLVIEKRDNTNRTVSDESGLTRDELYAIAVGSSKGVAAPGPGSGKPH